MILDLFFLPGENGIMIGWKGRGNASWCFLVLLLSLDFSDTYIHQTLLTNQNPELNVVAVTLEKKQKNNQLLRVLLAL